MSDDELKAAAERFSEWTEHDYSMCDDPVSYCDDSEILADAYLARLAADDQRAARIEELMIDVERLKGERDEARAAYLALRDDIDGDSGNFEYVERHPDKPEWRKGGTDAPKSL